MDTIHLVTLENSAQASILQSALQNEGIETFTKNEVLSSIMNIPGFQIEVEVFEKDYERAFNILKEGFPYLVNKEEKI